MVHAVTLGKYLLALEISVAGWSIPFIIGYTVFMCKVGGLRVVQMDISVSASYFLPLAQTAAKS